ncbi:TPA: helix-turn-helix domain containing protein, partial [Klebsiella quasipneumoniae]|nr:helix-turn-helix domain containing protein [Klebsiella quasipneumoniae]HCA6917001.1 helix-turn-helix domain containing protein [Klebsiella quasipneumoniae]HDE0879893.1 helix-turn-helix domain containing protein [Klebsiella quasipneumoniae]HDE3054756.1 helix-turn-helix domain containing protein [Klebsiella quasipneumoniae]
MSTSKHPNEIKINPNQGGKAAIERLVEAYGFTTRQALADHLEVSKTTLANRYMRDTFPADWIIHYALETGTSLNWLTTGQGLKLRSQTATTEELVMFRLVAGK